MKRIMFMLATAFCATTLMAQSATELAKEQLKQNEVYQKVLGAKPTKSAKKQAKELKKNGWTVPAGSRSIEEQITESQLYGAELTKDENGATMRRYILQTAIQTSGSFNAGYAAARSAAMVELASLMKTRIVAAMQHKLDNDQSQSLTATTIDKFNQRSKAIVDEVLTRSIPVLVVYREKPAHQFEVQVRLAFDKKEMAAQLKRRMQQQLEEEGDELEEIIDQVLEQN